MNNISERDLKLLYSQTDIIEAKPNMGITDIIQTYDLTKEVVRKYNTEKYDQVEISKLSEPYKEYFNYKEVFLKKHWDEIKDTLKRVTDGDYFFKYRATYEISFYDEEDVYEDLIPKGSPYWHWFRHYFLDYCSNNENWAPADICNKSFDWQYRNQVRVLLVGEKRPIGENYLDYEDKVTESEIDEKIIQLKKEYEKKKLEIKKSWS